MIAGLFLLFLFIQIFISSLDGLGAGANPLLVLGVLLAITRRSGKISFEYYLIAAGIILDLISVFPLGFFASSFFITFLVIRFLLKFIHRETAVAVAGAVFAASLLFRIIQQLLLVVFESAGATIDPPVLFAGVDGLRGAVRLGYLKWMVSGAASDVIIALLILGILFIGGRYVLPPKHTNVSSP